MSLMSSHRLKVETWWWHKPEAIHLMKEKCDFCPKLGDEFHVLFPVPWFAKKNI